MTLPASGTIKMSEVDTELITASNTQRSLASTAVRTLFGRPSGKISLSDGYSKTYALVPTGGTLYTYNIPSGAGGVGEGFSRNIASWTNNTGRPGKVNVSGTYSTTCEKGVHWTIYVDGVGVASGTPWPDQGGCAIGPWSFNANVNVQPNSVVILQVSFWGAYGSDRVTGGTFNIVGK